MTAFGCVSITKCEESTSTVFARARRAMNRSAAGGIAQFPERTVGFGAGDAARRPTSSGD